MARYDKLYEALAKRAVKQGVTDFETFLERADAAGLPRDVLEERLVADVEEGGPIFGKFIRSLSGAAATSVLASERQGADVARARAEDLISMSEMDDILDDADAEEMDDIGDRLEDSALWIWIAELVRTCERCLPLHGKIMTAQEWNESGYDPETMHEGWDEPCHCEWQPMDELSPDDLKELKAPLIRERVKTDTGLMGSKRTQRLVAQADLDKATAAVTKATESLEGRRTLRLMGQVNQGEE